MIAACLLSISVLLGGCGSGQVSDSGAYAKGVEALEAGDYDAAMTQFKTAVDQDSRKAEAYRGEGIVYARLGEFAGAVTMFERSLDAWKRSKSSDTAFCEDVQYYLAEAYANCGRQGEALGIYTELTDGLNPGRAYLMRGKAYTDWQDYDSAMADFDQVIANDPSYENCIQIYEILAAASRKADGASYLEYALESKISNKEDYYNQGLIYYYLGNYELARKNLQTACDMGNLDAVILLGEVCIQNGDTPAAREAYQKVVNNEENRALAYNGLALCDIADEDYDAALQNISKGLAENDPEVTESLLFNEIVVYERMLDFSTARDKMQAFAEQYPDNQEARRENLFLKSR
ncbi:MAG: tetratricopeptide repeat protein [Eubacterium sp.]|nr:tetratricopeptide repeat protein [Eubacterium sp.]